MVYDGSIMQIKITVSTNNGQPSMKGYKLWMWLGFKL